MFDPLKVLLVDVRITQARSTYQIVEGAAGFQAATDAAGLCNLFERRIQ
ncbi:hypothetical protein [Curtobacterium flaccumfaciens]|nr:hypothetical protein [Curtobacterium allii]MCE0459641.1 hypothetical protein [Curtobacterium allii]